MGVVSLDEPGGGERDPWLTAASDDPTAFAAFYRQNVPQLLAYFYRRTMCAESAADLTAETFAQLWASRRRFDPAKGSAIAWTMGIAGNLYRQFLRKGVVSARVRKRLEVEMPTLGREDTDRIESLVDLEALQGALRSAVLSLSPRLRDAVMLRVVLENSYEEVAAELGCSIGAARVRVSRGLSALSELLEARS